MYPCMYIDISTYILHLYIAIYILHIHNHTYLPIFLHIYLQYIYPHIYTSMPPYIYTSSYLHINIPIPTYIYTPYTYPHTSVYIYIYIPIQSYLEDICVHIHNHTYIWLHLSYKLAFAPKPGSLVVVSALWGWRREEPGHSCSHRQPPPSPGPFTVLGPALLSPAAHAPNSLNFWSGGQQWDIPHNRTDS